MILSAVILALFCGWRIARRTLFFAHMLQLEGYKPAAYLGWTRPRLADVGLRTSHILAIVWLIAGATMQFVLPPSAIPIFFLLMAATFASSRRYRRDRPKKPLAFTNRMRRILSLAGLLAVALLVVGALTGARMGGWPGATVFAAGFLVADLFAPLLVAVSVVLLMPVESLIRIGFKRAARRRLAERTELDVIAVTGSYGKTSVKNAVAEVLGHRFPVLATPASFNTPMGICRVINDELSNAHRVLILEMGIRNPGDIAELCAIARPRTAIITSVGIAHLESMGTIDAIAREKGSLLSCVVPGGHAVLNADDERVRRMGWDFEGTVWPVSCEGVEEARIRAADIEYGPDGARFTVTDETGDAIRMTTRLIGRHNVTNILLAVAVGRIFGLRLRQIGRAVARLAPVPHRLEVRREGFVTVIDDAFNSNPVGALNAVEMLGRMGSGRRFVVTPGMIELGEREKEENRLFGMAIARSADVAVLVGAERTAPIAEGLLAERFPSENIHVVRTLFEAKDLLRNELRDGDVVLFENDLPDQYNEP